MYAAISTKELLLFDLYVYLAVPESSFHVGCIVTVFLGVFLGQVIAIAVTGTGNSIKFILKCHNIIDNKFLSNNNCVCRVHIVLILKKKNINEKYTERDWTLQKLP